MKHHFNLSEAESPAYSGWATPAGVFSGAATPYRRHGAATPSGKYLDPNRRFAEKLQDSLASVRQQIDAEVESRRKTIGGIDQMWLHMSEMTDFNPVCASTYTFKGKLDREKFKAALEDQSEQFPRYRERVVDFGRNLHGARFERCADFDVDNHLRTIHLPGNAGKKELEAALSQFLSEDWDLSKPLWDCIIVDNYHDDDGAESAMITRGHHTLADGQGFVLSQLWNTSYRPELQKLMDGTAALVKDASRGKAKPSSLDKRLRSLDKYADSGVSALMVQSVMIFAFYIASIFSLFEGLLWTLFHALHAARLYLWVSWRTEFVTGSYRGARVAGREAASSKAFPISDVKIMQNAFSGFAPNAFATRLNGGKSKVANRMFHVTLNDVICACMTDVLADEMQQVKPAPGLLPQLRYKFNRLTPPPVGFFIPISIRKPGQWAMKNLSTGALAYLQPIANPGAKPQANDLYKHIHSAQSELKIVKKSLLPHISFSLAQLIISQTPIFFPTPLAKLPGPYRKYIVEPIFGGFMSSFPAILTNVPGPAKKRVSLCDVEIISWTALPPQAGKGTIGIGVISYANTICVTVAADAVRETRGVAARICEKFEKRFETYLEVAKEILADTEQGQKKIQ